MQAFWSVFFVTIAVVRGLRVDDDGDLRGSTTAAPQSAAGVAPDAAPQSADQETNGTEANTEVKVEECKDDDKVADMCATWATGDGCSSNMAYMHKQCKKTCNMCEGDATKGKVDDHYVAKLEKDLQSASWIREKAYGTASTAKKDAAAIVGRQKVAQENTVETEQKYFEACSTRKAAVAALPVAQKAEADAVTFGKEARSDDNQKRLAATLAKTDVKAAEDLAAMVDGNLLDQTKSYVESEEALSESDVQYAKTAQEVQRQQVLFDNADALKKKAEERWAEKTEVEEGLARNAEATQFEADNANPQKEVQEPEEPDISDAEKLNSLRAAATASSLPGLDHFPVGFSKYRAVYAGNATSAE